MNSLEFAQKMETDGELYYLELKDKSENLGLKTLFKLLADEEKKHYEMIESMKENIKLDNDSELIKDVKNVFERMFEEKKAISIAVSEDALRHALGIEDESIKFYKELLNDLASDLETDVIKIIIEEEKKHYVIIETLLDHISGGIIQGIASSEFEQLEDIKL